MTDDQGAGIRGTWVEGVEVRTSSSPSPTPQKCIAKHREAKLFPQGWEFLLVGLLASVHRPNNYY